MRHLSHETRRDMRLYLRERDEIFRLFKKKSSIIKYIGKIVYYSTETHKIINVGAF